MPCFVLNAATDPESHPQTELYWGHVNPIGPRACYDEAKRVAETMCYAYQKQVVELIRLLVTNRWNWRLSAHLCINFACHSLSKRSNVPVFKIFDIAFFKGRPRIREGRPCMRILHFALHYRIRAHSAGRHSLTSLPLISSFAKFVIGRAVWAALVFFG